MKFFFILVVLSFILSCSKETSISTGNTPNTSIIPSNSDDLTGSWYKEYGISSLIPAVKLPIAIRDEGNVLYVKECRSSKWNELEKIDNKYYLFGFVRFSIDDNGELLSHDNYPDDQYIMRKVSNEISTTFGMLNLSIEGKEDIEKQEDVCADVFFATVDDTEFSSMTINIPHGEDSGFIRLILHLDTFKTGSYDLGNNKLGLQLGIWDISPSSASFELFFVESGNLEISQRSNNSITGNFSAVLNDVDGANRTNATGNFNVSFY